jgi:glycosyltransferase involved in cell wall biosynthesis
MFLQTGKLIPKPTSPYQKWGRLYRALWVPFVARRAKRIVTISNFSREDILRSIDDIDLKGIDVTYLSCDSLFQNALVNSGASSGVYGEVLSRPFILCLGAEDPRKNTLRLVHSYLKLLQTSDISENLVICGYANWQVSESYLAVRAAGAESRIKFLEFISTEDLALLYRNASAFVYPSLYEGFGIPLLEAFSAGCPVAASNLTSIPEVGGEAALYFDPLSEEEITASMLQAVTDSVLRKRLVARGYARAGEFSWEATALRTLSIYRQCMDGARK